MSDEIKDDNMIAKCFQTYVEHVYTEGPISDRQRIELERAFFAGFHASMEMCGYAASQLGEDTACKLLTCWEKEIETYLEKVKTNWLKTN